MTRFEQLTEYLNENAISNYAIESADADENDAEYANVFFVVFEKDQDDKIAHEIETLFELEFVHVSWCPQPETHPYINGHEPACVLNIL